MERIVLIKDIMDCMVKGIRACFELRAGSEEVLYFSYTAGADYHGYEAADIVI